MAAPPAPITVPSQPAFAPSATQVLYVIREEWWGETEGCTQISCHLSYDWRKLLEISASIDKLAPNIIKNHGMNQRIATFLKPYSEWSPAESRKSCLTIGLSSEHRQIWLKAQRKLRMNLRVANFVKGNRKHLQKIKFNSITKVILCYQPID